ncbi:TetR/AcrR family transcriptional regulator [Streptomyces sp. MST-110588]|uniref:TetR/AcrR family transcriptional regulator n=1 Tax=Streptomyces sp. MST-110588 TaxID=2833628 RepID=UPI001F5C4700|nr:TetR/AcrR family transcriptional regulator [Streptomyces sp. MST-110588]UNO38907.1 TetR/AcrR family transcriptional regulator [Streptomyces sp. MST-110588]
MTAIPGARARARGEVAIAIKDEARRQLASEGAAKLSLRAVARELGMVSSALYRYFPSRDELLTALIIDAYNAVGEAAERAGATVVLPTVVRARPMARWTAICQGVRSWALAHPHEYALIYGSPVPGYSAPRSTTQPAARVGLALIAVVHETYAAGRLKEPADPLPDVVIGEALALAAELGVELPGAVVARLIGAWAQLFGLVSFELFGQFHGVVGARAEFFEQAAEELGRSVGLPTPR